jgi:hypothetical protein
MVEIPDASITVTKVWSLNKVQGRITTTTDFIISDIAGNVKIDNVWANTRPIDIEYVSSGSAPFDNMSFDNVEYDEDGVPLLGADSVDTIIRSNFTDASLGLRPEDINVDGGAYVDTYSSHAPEELVPGVTFDTLDMKVYTKITNGDVLGYRIFTNMLRETTFLRIADDYTTTLSSALAITDTEIYVTDAAKLPAPSPSNGVPGVIFVNGERITYYRNYATETVSWAANIAYDTDTVLSYSGNVYISIDNLTADFDLGNIAQHTGNVQQLPSVNILGQIRRGTQGTPMMVEHLAGTSVVDGSIEQTVPSTKFGNATLAANTIIQATFTPSYNLRLTSTIDVAVGDIITQATTGVSATVVGTDITSNVVLVNYNNTNRFDFANVAILLSGNIAANVGDYLTQSVSNANLQVVSATGANVVAVYTSLNTLTGGQGNVAVNGVDTGEYPRTVGATTNALSNIAINGNYTSNVLAFSDAVYPMVEAIAGKIDASGQVIVLANTEVVTANVWYNLGASAPTDGTGFEGATTEQVLFLKQATATNTVVTSVQDLLTTEDTVNILTTENGQQILEE